MRCSHFPRDAQDLPRSSPSPRLQGIEGIESSGSSRPRSDWSSLTRSRKKQEVLVGPPPSPSRTNLTLTRAAPKTLTMKLSRDTASSSCSLSLQLTDFSLIFLPPNPAYRADTVGAGWRELRCSLLEAGTPLLTLFTPPGSIKFDSLLTHHAHQRPVCFLKRSGVGRVADTESPHPHITNTSSNQYLLYGKH